MNDKNQKTAKNIFHFIHDVRNPLSSMSALLDMLILKKCSLPSEKQLEIIMLCKSQLEKMRVTLSNFTDITKISDVIVTLKNENIFEIIKKTLSEYMPRISIEKKYLNLEPNNIEFKIDRRIFINIIQNMLEHMMNLSAFESESKLKYYINNNALFVEMIISGPTNLTDKECESIFDPESCIIDTSSGIRYNKGYGLTYNKMLAERLGGNFSITFKNDKKQHLILHLPECF